MKKNAFTLVELIIAITIIGLIAAFVAPAVLDLIPDKNKAKVLKYNAQINNAIIDLMNDDNIVENTSEGIISSGGEVEKNTEEGLELIEDFDTKLSDKIGVVEDKTADGSKWTIVTDNTLEERIITIDLDPSNNSIIYDENIDNIKTVDSFVFKIDKFGTVSAGDALTKAYLKNTKKLNDRKNDFANAEIFLSDFKKQE